MSSRGSSGFGLLSWLWWPVLLAGWGLAGAVLAGEALLGRRGARSAPSGAPPPLPARPGRRRPFLALLAALAGLPALTACATPDANRDAAISYCLGDGAPPVPGASTSGGDLASCQAIVAGRYGRGGMR